MPTESSVLASEIRGSLLIALISAIAAMAYLTYTTRQEPEQIYDPESSSSSGTSDWTKQNRKILAAAAKMPEVALRIDRLKAQPERATKPRQQSHRTDHQLALRRPDNRILLDPGADAQPGRAGPHAGQHIGDLLDPAMPIY